MVLALVLLVVAGGVAFLVERRRPDAPTQRRYAVPQQVDRADFARPEAPWLVVAFTSATCHSCAAAVAKAVVLESPEVAFQEVEVGAEPELHRRYSIDGVPTLVVADGEGVVRASFVGVPTATDLWAAVAEVRSPGSLPEGCHRHDDLVDGEPVEGRGVSGETGA